MEGRGRAAENLPASEDRRLEIENRLRNLSWTVSGDYSLDIRPDADVFLRNPALALYDAVKQGAFVSHFDPRALAIYTLQKRAMGADEGALTTLTQLCVDAAAYPLASRERRGVEEMRARAFRELLEGGFFRGRPGQLRKCLILRFLGRPVQIPEELLPAVEIIDSLSGARDTEAIIAAIDRLYNSLADPAFEALHGDLKAVRRVTGAELAAFSRNQALSDRQIQQVLEEYLSAAREELLKTGQVRPARREPILPVDDRKEEAAPPNPAEAEKVYAFIERQFGKSNLPPAEREKRNRRLCTGIHRGCSLHFTQGVLQNPVVKNTQYLRTQMQSMKNEMYFQMRRQNIQRSVTLLSAMLKQAQIQRMDEDAVPSEQGRIVPGRLWEVGRIRDPKLFDREKRRDQAGFLVDILLDSSSSQTLRQPQIAAQGYIVSQALSLAGIPHRVCGFCSYWDYTMIHRYRDYDDPIEANRNILQFRAFGENRDALAIRAIREGMLARPEEKKILILLSDGRPNNLGVRRPGSRHPPAYVGEEAVRDTALEVRKTRSQGIGVLGIFVGGEEDLAAERKIFGKEFIYSRSILSFAHIVGTYLRTLMEDSD